MNLMSFFKNLFASPKISDDKLRKFTEVHIQRIAAQNTSSKYDTLLSDTETAYTGYFGAITDEDTKFAIQQSLTKTVNNILEEFKQKIRQKEGAVRSNWDKDSPVYQEFFPNGLTEYGSANLTNIETFLNRITTAGEAHITELGQAFVDLFKDVRTRFIAARTNQLRKIGEVKDSKTISSTARATLENQLMKNLLTLAIEFMNNPDAGMTFFDQSIIQVNSSTPEVEEDKENK